MLCQPQKKQFWLFDTVIFSEMIIILWKSHTVTTLELTVHVCSDEKADEALNGEDKSESGADTQNSEGNAEEEDRLRTNCYYDKSKSFFDNISCDDTRSDHMQHTFNMSLNL